MLQQTQVDRVVPKYKAFVKRFPTPARLSTASLSSVLRTWSGLGYNRRAKYLWEAAKMLKGDTLSPGSQGVALEKLPGVGDYTAKAVRVFAFNIGENMIETNIRAVYLHHFFPRSRNVPDARILPYMGVPKGIAPREWYAALMDYGAYLKKKYPNPSRRSHHHTKQSAFKGSDREIRGAILKAHLTGKRVRGFDPRRVRELRKKIRAEGFI